jgi:hypothetical protein
VPLFSFELLPEGEQDYVWQENEKDPEQSFWLAMPNL